MKHKPDSERQTDAELAKEIQATVDTFNELRMEARGRNITVDLAYHKYKVHDLEATITKRL